MRVSTRYRVRLRTTALCRRRWADARFSPCISRSSENFPKRAAASALRISVRANQSITYINANFTAALYQRLMHILRVASLVTLLFVGGCTQPIYNVERHPTPLAARTLSADEMERAIIQAATAYGWSTD